MIGLNLDRITAEAYMAIHEIDRSFIGTPHYMGVAYFWAYEYRHCLRDASIATLVGIHRAFLKSGLAVDGESDRHLEIIKRYTRENL